ncbi:MAG TPA: HNH endonuclease [Blastocatellia bacterium]|nr:HNH endonuclease [Blastocatellia bacterium]
MTCHFCQQPVTRRDLNIHHLKPKSEGGTATAPAHKACHVRHHSENGDFRRWGRKCGLVTASYWVWIFNLKFGAGQPDPHRRIPFGR